MSTISEAPLGPPPDAAKSNKHKPPAMSFVTLSDQEKIPDRVIDGSKLLSIPFTHQGTTITPFRHASEVPKGAIILGRNEMEKMLGTTVREWQPRSEMWSYSIGVGALAAITGATGIFMNSLYRERLKLSKGTIASSIPLLFIAPAMTIAVHHVLVQNPVLLQDPPCPPCLITRGIALQFATGFAFPLFLVTLSSTASARVTGTMDIPNVFNVRAMGSFLRRTYRPLWMPYLGALILSNTIAAGVITSRDCWLAPKVWERVGLVAAPSLSESMTDKAPQSNITSDVLQPSPSEVPSE